jgi:amino acid transporter
MLAAIMVTIGNAGGVGSTVAGISRVPFVVGIDHYLPAAFGKIHPRWKTPYVSILVQAIISGAILLAIQVNETVNGAYQILVDAAIILYFIPFLYMYAAAMFLAESSRPHSEIRNAVLVPGGKFGVRLCAGLGFLVVLGGIGLSLIPPAETRNATFFEFKLVGCTAAAVLIGSGFVLSRAASEAQEERAGRSAGRLVLDRIGFLPLLVFPEPDQECV